MNKLIKRLLTISACALTITSSVNAQDRTKEDPKYKDAQDSKLTEVWTPEPRVVTPGKQSSDAPSDAIVLFGGNDLSAWKNKDGGEAKWSVADGAFTVVKGTGTISTKQEFGDCQLHVEWKISPDVKGTSQERGNSGIFLMGQYEVQVLDSYAGKTYVNGQAGSIYKQAIPLVNACRPPGEWQSYDIVFTAPRFGEDGRLKTAAIVTIIQNGVLILDHFTIWGSTGWVGIPKYTKHKDKESLVLQDHGNPTSFRNIWVRPL